MNAYLLAATALLAGLGPVLWVSVRRPLMEAVVALEMAGTLATLVLLLIAQGTHRAPFFDLAVVSGVLSFAGGLAFTRFLERWE